MFTGEKRDNTMVPVFQQKLLASSKIVTTVFWDVMSCSLVDVCQSFGDKYAAFIFSVYGWGM
jgi:hypothetical protein